MNSLSSKRFHAYEKKNTNNNIKIKLDNISENTDDIESKLDTIIASTNTNVFYGNIGFTFVSLQTLSTPVIDIGVNSKTYNFSWVGIDNSSHLNYSIEISIDNVTFYTLPSALFLSTGTNVEGSYSMPFQYHKLVISNSHSSTAIASLAYSGRQ
tara:strand:- start:441 stop:902 length:462 start_codon:yes stop_codon:yes gene_type:complete